MFPAPEQLQATEQFQDCQIFSKLSHQYFSNACDLMHVTNNCLDKFEYFWETIKEVKVNHIDIANQFSKL